MIPVSLKKTLLLTGGVILVATSVAGAAWLWSERNVLSASFCPALADDATYEANGLEPYAKIIPGKQGWIFRTKNDFRPEWAASDKTVGYLLSLQNAFKAHNASLVIVMPPVRGLVHADQLPYFSKVKLRMNEQDSAWDKYEASIKDLQAKGVRIVGLNRADATDDFFYKRNHHWTAQGAKATAMKVGSTIRTMPAYNTIAHQEYMSIETGIVEYKSSFEKAFKTICKADLPTEEARHFETIPKVAATDADILSEPPIPQVVLLGTSNSVSDSSEANFIGFLKEYIGADILNFAFVGAGIDTSIMSYLQSPHFKTAQPKIVIWEVPGYYDFNIMDNKLFNQVIPAAFGACAPAPATGRMFSSVSSGTTILFDFKKPIAPEAMQPISYAPLSQNGSYLHLDFSRGIKNKFSLKFHYENSGTKKQDFSRSDDYPQDGNFYTLFPAQDIKTLNKITLVLPEGEKPVNLTAQICPLPQKI